MYSRQRHLIFTANESEIVATEGFCCSCEQILWRRGNIYVRVMKHFKSNLWNVTDALSLCLLVIGIALGNMRATSGFERIHQNDNETLEGVHTAGRVCFALAISFCFFRLFYFYSVNMRLGPKVLMVKIMVCSRDCCVV